MSPPTTRRRPESDDAGSAYGYREDDTDVQTIVWASVGTLFGFKLVTSILILVVFPTIDALLIVLALSVPWFFAMIYYVVFFEGSRFRLLRARARRRKLIYQEWNVD